SYHWLYCKHEETWRTSAIVSISDLPRALFYVAQDNAISPFGVGDCYLTIGRGPQDAHLQDKISFCLDRRNIKVELQSSGDKLSVDAPLYVSGSGCEADEGIQANAFLGHDGEDATPGQDRDTFDFAGKRGERVRVKLERDGGIGSLGTGALLRVLDQGGGEIARRHGAPPLKLDLTLPGPVRIVVQREGEIRDGFRGGYMLTVTPASGRAERRVLLPREDVEH
ncbi:MAG: hypothetical protein AB7X49_16230, partial [Geminicoccaceae bacterium]